MRVNRTDESPLRPAQGSELVECSVHHSRRLAKFCTPKPVCNADRVLIGYTYQCREDMDCKGSANPRDSFLRQNIMNNVTDGQNDATVHSPTFAGGSMDKSINTPTTTTTTTTDDVTTSDKNLPQQEVRTGAPRAPNRYYDLANQRSTGATGAKKVCWNCGMEGHEKPDCRNALCRTCHSTRNYHHICQEPFISPFIILSPTLPLSSDMFSVQCVSCLSLGHFDCSSSRKVATPSCCFCTEIGHSAYDCQRRKNYFPDRWVTRVLETERGLKHWENGKTSKPTTPTTTIQTTAAMPYYANNRSNYNTSYKTEVDQYSRHGEKRPRWDNGDHNDSFRQYERNQNRQNYDWDSERGRRNSRFADDNHGDGRRQRVQQLYGEQHQSYSRYNNSNNYSNNNNYNNNNHNNNFNNNNNNNNNHHYQSSVPTPQRRQPQEQHQHHQHQQHQHQQQRYSKNFRTKPRGRGDSDDDYDNIF